MEEWIIGQGLWGVGIVLTPCWRVERGAAGEQGAVKALGGLSAAGEEVLPGVGTFLERPPAAAFLYRTGELGRLRL